METRTRFGNRAPKPEYRCTSHLHFGKTPDDEKVKNKCLPIHCEHLLMKAAFENWCRENNVHLVGD